MTQRLYQQDPYTTSFEADVVETRETEDGPALVFSATYFYPESGGQPFDLGTIDGVSVVKVVEAEDGVVLHVIERLPSADRVRCEIDAGRRRDHMQQHSGQHILSAACVRELGAQTTSFHLGASVSTIDLDRPSLTAEEIERAERAANDVVGRAVPIRSRVVTGDEARSLELRKPPPEGERLRIVEVEGFDQQACCGTHPRSSGEVGPIVVRSFETLKRGTRVEFLCGERALADYHDTVARVRALANVLSSSEPSLVETATRLRDERKTLAKKLRKLESEALLREAQSWIDEATDVDGVHVLAKSRPDLDPGELRTVAAALVSEPGRIVLLGSVARGRAHLVFARSDDVDADMAAVMERSAEAVDGRGGGSPSIAQGGGANTGALEDALAAAVSSLVP